MARYVLSGATSFLGRHLARGLLEAGHAVYAIVRPGSANRHVLPAHPGCHVILADVAQTETWRRAIGRADLFLHLAWDGAGMEGRAKQEVQAENIRQSLACLRAAAQLGARRFVFFGSQAEYGPQTQPVDETAPCAPVTEYGKAKLEFGRQAADLARELGIGYTHLRVFSVYGPGDHPWTLVNTCLEGFLSGQEVALSSCEQPWNFLYISDLVRAVLALCDSPEDRGCGVFNIAGDQTRPLREYVDAIWRLCGSRGAPRYGARGDRLEWPYGIMPDNEKLHRTTAWTQQVSFEMGIRTMLDQAAGEGTR